MLKRVAWINNSSFFLIICTTHLLSTAYGVSCSHRIQRAPCSLVFIARNPLRSTPFWFVYKPSACDAISEAYTTCAAPKLCGPVYTLAYPRERRMLCFAKNSSHVSLLWVCGGVSIYTRGLAANLRFSFRVLRILWQLCA